MEIIPWYCSNIYDETNYVHPTSSHAYLYKQIGMYFGLPIYVSIKKKKYKNNSEVRKTLNFSTSFLA